MQLIAVKAMRYIYLIAFAILSPFAALLRAEAIVRVILDGDKVLAEEHLLQSEKQRFRDVAQGTDGSLYAITDAGRLYQIKTSN